jgi:hypothetical protein
MTRLTASAIAIGLGIGLVGCVPAPAGTTPRRDQTVEDWRTNLLVERAAFDLACPKDQLQTRPLGHELTMGVVGCSKRAVYLWEYSRSAWLLNGMISGALDASSSEAPGAAPKTDVSQGPPGSTGGMTNP